MAANAASLSLVEEAMGKSFCNGNGPGGASASNGQGAGPVVLIITGVRLNEQHQLLNP
jgi:hypothetical protein